MSPTEDNFFNLLVNISVSSETTLDRLSSTLKIFVEKYFDNQDFTDVFWDGVSLSANTTYRVAIKPTTGAGGDIYVVKLPVESAAAREFFPEGVRWQGTSRAGGAWTDVATDIYPMALWISSMSLPGTDLAQFAYIG